MIAGGRCFTFSRNEWNNILPGGRRGFDYFLAAYDAFNGLPLWKVNCGPFKAMHKTILWPQDITISNWHNAGQPVADAHRVLRRIADGDVNARELPESVELLARDAAAPTALATVVHIPFGAVRAGAHPRTAA